MQTLKKIETILDNVAAENRYSLSEPEVYEIFTGLGLNLPQYLYFSLRDVSEIPSMLAGLAEKLPGAKIAVKISSSKTLHKTDSGGILTVPKQKDAIQKALNSLKGKFKDCEGILAAEFIEHPGLSLGGELLLGARSDHAFGPIITLGPGGTHAESLNSSLREGVSLSVAPVDASPDWKDFLDSSWIWKYVSGKVRGAEKLADESEIIRWLEAFSLVMKNFRDSGDFKYAVEEMEVNPLAVSKGQIIALDALLRFRKAEKKQRTKPSKKGVSGLLNPAKVGVTGVSEKKMNMGRIILNNVLKAGFVKENMFIIKDGIDSIDGVKCFPSASSLPFTADMYVVAVPSSQAPEVIKDAGLSKKVNGVILISGGMGEKSGSEGLADRLLDEIKKAKQNNPDFVLSGGNSLGIVLNRARVNTLFIPEYKMTYPLGSNPNMVKTAFVSQSGAFVVSVISKMPWLKPVYSITVGNQQDITVVDYLENLVDDDELKVMLVYIEGFKYSDGLNLVKIIQKAKAKGKRVIIYKAGRTSAGQKAVMGHTASIAGDYAVSKLLMEKAGALVLDTFDDFCDFAMLACYCDNYKIKGPGAFFMSNAGFETAGMADNISGILNARIQDEGLIKRLNGIMKEFKLDAIVDVKNPMDMTPMANDKAVAETVKAVLASEEFAGVILSMVPLTPELNALPKSGGYPDDMEKSFLKETADEMKNAGKPVIFCAASGLIYEPYVEYALNLGIPVFRSADRAVRIYSKYIAVSEFQ
ncbi:MAG: acetate--CoA ligase family protein [Elusimicrobia bacterium]|nr:acetate--CoA ligase family protein [Elusimicrobiota bacterium]